MAVDYTITIAAIRAGNQGELADVVREIDLEILGEDSGHRLSLPARVILDEADPGDFVAYEDLTEAQVLSWADSQQDVLRIKEHIDIVLNREIARAALELKPLPWVEEE
jgi:hypothetical protein